MRQRVRHLHAREALLSLAIADEYGQVQAQVGDVRKRASGIECQRGQNRKDSLVEVFRGPFNLRVTQLRVVVNEDSLLLERWHQSLQASVSVIHQLLHFAADGNELGARSHAVRPNFHQTGLHLRLQAGHPDHEEFVQVRTQDRNELHALQQWIPDVLGFF